MIDLQSLQNEVTQAVDAASDLADLDAVRVRYLGKKGQLTEILKSLGRLPPKQRPQIGQQVNKVKAALQQKINEKRRRIQATALQAELLQASVDVTLPGVRQPLGAIHPIAVSLGRVTDFFRRLGFDVVQGPQIENEYYNFEALNILKHHPARAAHDTFYFDSARLLRTHTSGIQIREMADKAAPFRLIAPGRVYRCDSDQTHTPMFHQIEGLLVDEHISFAHLKGVLQAFLNDFFETELTLRFRPSYFPFTEPSAEVDIAFNDQWLEVLGCGMVHPKVLQNVNIDTQKYSGFAFGLGIERLTMVRYGVTDIRTFFQNDIRFLEQFA